MKAQDLLVALCLTLSFPNPISSLYFYLQAGAERCFLEELPKDTIVTGIYKGEEWSPETKTYHINAQLGVQITVTEVYSGERIVNTRGVPQGRFTFTSHESGDHSICLRTNYTGGWFTTPQIKMHLDMAIGEAKIQPESEKEHVKDLAGRVRELNSRLHDIRREQQFQREREIQFRDLSEATNRRAVYWSLVQLAVLFYMCVWQLRHLRGFFESKKTPLNGHVYLSGLDLHTQHHRFLLFIYDSAPGTPWDSQRIYHASYTNYL